ncbi:hypothetical protein ABZ840_33465 [Streptomyces sp. NPDC047117]|uniref:hypothetical protein n=1 Tax=Streptomyces sp. NPDC047117 TaxID=3155379 RepID=UPI00340D7CE5
MVGHEVHGTLYPAYLENFYRAGVRLTPDHHFREIRREAGALVAVVHNAHR